MLGLSALVTGITILSGLVVLISFAYRWIRFRIMADIVDRIQELVNKLKEYDLDTRAGLLICKGDKLAIDYIDSNLQKILGRPSCVDDLLPVTMRDKHLKIIMKIGGKDLPESLSHPLRNVQILDKDGISICAKLIVGRLGKFMLQQHYYVVVQPNELFGFRPPSLGLSRRLSTELSSSWSQMTSSPETRKLALRKYGSAPSFSVSYSESSPASTPSATGKNSTFADCEMAWPHEHPYSDKPLECTALLPSQTQVRAEARADGHARATVLCVDIVGYTGQCASRGLEDLSGWMERIHAAADALLARHAVRRVETRGDSFVFLAGTGSAAPPSGASDGEGRSGDGGERDGEQGQATRMLAFARELWEALGGVDGTEARMGMATGPVVLARVAHAGDTRPAEYILGAAAVAAARLERTGRAGIVLLDEAAAREYAAEGGAATPPLLGVAGLGEPDAGAGPVAAFDCAAGRFLDAAGGMDGGRSASAGGPARLAAAGLRLRSQSAGSMRSYGA